MNSNSSHVGRLALAVIVGVLTFAARAADVFVPTLWNTFFSVTFETSVTGDPLTDETATGGTWGEEPVPEDAEATIVDHSGTKAVNFVTANGVYLAFGPRVQNPTSSKACLYRMKFNDSEALWAVPSGAKGAFTIAATNGTDAVFMGYDPTKEDWVPLTLKSGTVTPAFGTFFDLATRYKKIGTTYCLSYYVKIPSGDYEPLYDSSNNYLFELEDPATLAMPKISLFGAGEMGDFSGVGQKGGVFTVR